MVKPENAKYKGHSLQKLLTINLHSNMKNFNVFVNRGIIT